MSHRYGLPEVRYRSCHAHVQERSSRRCLRAPLPRVQSRVAACSQGEFVKGRRGWGEGSVCRRPNGTWSGVLSLGKRTGPDGRERRIRRTVYARTKTEVLAKLQNLRLEHPGGLDLGEDLTVAVWLEKWLRDIVTNVRASTLESYELTIRRHVIPQLGHFPLRRLKPTVIAQVYSDLATAGYPRARSARSICGCTRHSKPPATSN